MAGDDHTEWIAYHYNPSKPAAVIFILLFLAISLLHTYHLIRTRTWFFIPLVIGGYFETVGYLGRAKSANESPDWTLPPYIIQSVLLLVAPALFAASIYMELGRIIVAVNGHMHSMIRVNWLTKIFVAGDVVSFLMQSGGAGMLAKAKSGDDQKNGERIITGGLLLQIIFFGLYMISSIVFQRRMSSRPTAESASIPWVKHMYALHGTSMLILVRSIFRVAEYVQGQDGALLSKEIYIYIFDAVLMFLVMVIVLVVHPSEINFFLGKGRKVVTKGGFAISEPMLAV